MGVAHFICDPNLSEISDEISVAEAGKGKFVHPPIHSDAHYTSGTFVIS